jgi:phosphoketolase
MARADGSALAAWARGYGVIRHDPRAVRRIRALARTLAASGHVDTEDSVYRLLAALDRLTNAAMWVVVHMTYARRVDLSGAPLPLDAFKPNPEGHTGGSLNVVPAYAGYLAANALTATTRAWLLGQGHCAAAIEAVNALAGNLSPAQDQRYGPDEAGLSRLCADFYSYAIRPDGEAAAPLGSHVNAHTAGGLAEGGYLGFAETQYVHMPLKGERLVAIVSDGAFEEQRGGDWSPRWWRASDSGLVVPVLIFNGRRIEQRTEIAQDGGAGWLKRHMRLNGFEPVEIDGRDPAEFVWAILEAERRLTANGAKAETEGYPARLPSVIAKTVKGYGFAGAGTNRAHNLPLDASPHLDEAACGAFHASASRLFVPREVLAGVLAAFDVHAAQSRPRERDNPLATRRPPAPALPPAPAQDVGRAVSPMASIDAWFCEFVRANPRHRFRIGNPDELASNGMARTLALLKHRVNRPEPGNPEAVDGAVITALNEEAVIGAALGNKGGLSLAVTYEAFAVKMLGAIRQDIIFARQQVEAGRPPGWIGLALIATSHLWENGKNQQSHQDPAIGEALMAEMADVSRVFFPADAATAVESLRNVYALRGIIGCVIAPKRAVPVAFDAASAAAALEAGAATVEDDAKPQIQFVAAGAYQLIEARRAAARLRERGFRVHVTALIEPGRFRVPRDRHEARFVASGETVQNLFPRDLLRVLVCHTRPEPMLGVLRRIDGGPGRTIAHGYLNRGGTLDTFGMLFANRCTWAHLTASAAVLLQESPARFLDLGELAAVEGRGDPAALR